MGRKGSNSSCYSPRFLAKENIVGYKLAKLCALKTSSPHPLYYILLSLRWLPLHLPLPSHLSLLSPPLHHRPVIHPCCIAVVLSMLIAIALLLHHPLPSPLHCPSPLLLCRHCGPLPSLSLVDCCLFTPSVVGGVWGGLILSHLLSAVVLLAAASSSSFSFPGWLSRWRLCLSSSPVSCPLLLSSPPPHSPLFGCLIHSIKRVGSGALPALLLPPPPGQRRPLQNL